MRSTSITSALLVGILLGISGCNGDSASSDTPQGDTPSETLTEPFSVSFVPLALPATAAEKAALTATDSLSVDGVSTPLAYNEIMRTGYQDNGEIFGAVKDKDGNVITFTDGTPYLCTGTNEGVGSGLDFSSILQRDDKLYMVSQFECSIGAMYMSELQQAADGSLTPKAGTLRYIPQGEHGGWTHCAGMVTPWQSHLGSEEYESDARDVEGNGGDTYFRELKKYWKEQYGSISPYFYGWITETTIENGEPGYAKHYSMGRFSHEMAYVMPDRKTVYLADDGTNVGFFMYVADTAGDLSSGTLYAAKFTQRERNRGGAFDLSWIKLARASDSAVKAVVDAAPAFSDIFETADPLCGAVCPAGFTAVNTSAGEECLKLNDGMETAAAFLETRRYAALKGATTELRKEEGIDYDPVHNRLFVAISEISMGMEDNQKYGTPNTQYDLGGSNDIRLPLNSCGGVYALSLTADAAKGSDYVAGTFDAVLIGESKDYKGTAYEGNGCDVDKIASPDNLTYLANTRTLIVAEDSASHSNNMVWAYDLNTRTLQRIAAMPEGAEATSTGYYNAIGNYSYLTLVNQHPTELKNGTVGAFRVKNALTAGFTPAASETACDGGNGFTWNAALGRCEADLPGVDYTVPASNDTPATAASCYTTGNGVVFGSDFECGLIQPWAVYSAASDIDWTYGNFGTGLAQITGYGADDVSDDWLISPRIAFAGDETLTFDYALNYNGSTCDVLVSTDYNGTGDPAAATWETIATYTESKGGWTLYPSSAFDLSKYGGNEGYLAFRHTNAVKGVSGTWEIDNILLKGSGTVYVPFQAAFTLSSDTLLTGEYFELKGSVSGGSTPYGYHWDLGNGDTAETSQLCYKYDAEGNYTVTLWVSDTNGSTADAAPRTVRVSVPLDEKIPVSRSQLRVATYNAYLNRAASGELYEDLGSGKDAQVKNVANIIQQVRPDVLLLNEFDYNGTANVARLLTNYLNVAQGDGLTAIDYPYVFVAPSNTGIQSGKDFNSDGQTTGDDAFGYGDFPGQYGMVVLSRYPIDTANVRTFQTFLWKDMPDRLIPAKAGVPYFSDDVMGVYRLSSKSHWDIPVTLDGKRFHVLADHPTPPTFDDGDKDGSNGADDPDIIDWNGLRNHDEIRLWSDYVKNDSAYLYDDKGVYGGLSGDTRFIILGDHNADPDEGDSYRNAIMQLLGNPMVNASVTPTSKGATSEGVANREPDDTANWSMRADYVLPSRFGFAVTECHVYWPQQDDVKHYLVEKSASGGENSSDHRMVWCDLNLTDVNATVGAPDAAVETLSTDFESGSLAPWTAVSLASNKDWSVSSYSGNTFAKANGYGGDTASDDWLISPKIAFDGTQKLRFLSATKYSGPALQVKISTDYDGKGEPQNATWYDLTATLSAGNYVFTDSGEIDLSAYSGEGYIAFRYLSDGVASGEAATWEVDDINVTK